MAIKKTASLILSIIFTISLTQVLSTKNVHAETSPVVKKTFRIQGTDRYKTSKAIAQEVNNTTLENVVLTSGHNFPDGLSGSTLAKKLNAPLLMAGSLTDSKDAFDYIAEHLNQNGNVYILGGTGAVSQDTENALVEKGYKVTRVFGKDRFETNNSIVDSLNSAEGTPVFISNAYGFADVLSASSIAAINGYPLLLTNSNVLPELVKGQLSKIKPSKVYIIGGAGAITSNVEDQIKKMLPSAEVIRLAGSDRYETSMNVYEYFNLDTKNIVLASGRDYPDALSGSQLAAKLNASIVLSDENNLDSQQNEFDKKSIENFYILGGNGALSSNVEQAITFDKEKEIASIRALYNAAIQAVRLKDINQCMLTVDKNSPTYDFNREVYQSLFDYLNENDMDIIPTIDSFDVVSINYKEASVKVTETDGLTDNINKTTEYQSATTLSNIKKVDGEWKFYSTQMAQ